MHVEQFLYEEKSNKCLKKIKLCMDSDDAKKFFKANFNSLWRKQECCFSTPS